MRETTVVTSTHSTAADSSDSLGVPSIGWQRNTSDTIPRAMFLYTPDGGLGRRVGDPRAHRGRDEPIARRWVRLHLLDADPLRDGPSPIPPTSRCRA